MQMSRRALLGATAAALALIGTGGDVSADDTALSALLGRISTNFLREHPEYATSMAVSEDQAGGRYIDRLTDVSKAGSRRRRAFDETVLAALRAIDRNRLSPPAQVSLDVVATAWTNSITTARFEYGDGATAPYVLTQISGAYTSVPDFLSTQHPVIDLSQTDAYLTRLSRYAQMLDQEREVLRADSEAGVMPPNFCIHAAVNQLREFTAIAPAENPLVTSLQYRLLEVESISDADRAALTERARSILADEILPAYQRQIDALSELLPRASADAGIWKLPQGQDIYAAALLQQTSTGIGADEVHQMGLNLVASIGAEMDAILRAQGLNRGSVADRMNALASRPDQLYPSTDAGRAQLLQELNSKIEEIRARMGEVFGTLPRASLEVRRIPQSAEAGAPGGYYQNGALDGSRPGAYYINLRDPAREWPKYALATLIYHECIPGHHWQISIERETTELPFVRSALLTFGAYSEGWALYSEQLADELGLYADDPFGRLGYLESMLFRASRLAVDTGLHDQRWTRERAISFMVEATGRHEGEITTEVERYCVWPGQACSYMVGHQAINRMRASARESLADAFDLKSFHDTLLTSGPVPLSVAERMIRAWVDAAGGR